jgi:hypothetical protein
MKLFGYTESKTLVQVDLTPEIIVQHNIDPWRLDLCDPDPVVFPHGDRVLHFRKLGAFSFAYRLNHAIYVGMKDDLGEVCLQSGNFQVRTSQYTYDVEMRQPRRTGEPFSRHWLQFLSGCAGNKPAKAWEFQTYAPKSREAITIQGSTLSILPDRRLVLDRYPVNFAGTMFTEVTLPMKLPQELNWVFEALRPFTPRVWMWPYFENCMRGHSITAYVNVEAAYDDFSENAIVRRIRSVTQLKGKKKVSVTGQGIEFEYQNCSYQVNRIPRSRTECLHFSLDDLHSVRADEVLGTRIAWFDMSRRLAQPVSGWTVAENWEHAKKHRFLYLGKGYKYLLPELLADRADSGPPADGGGNETGSLNAPASRRPTTTRLTALAA